MKLEIAERQPRETTREYALRILSDNILKLKLVPGTALSEQEVAGELAVSRTPVREAFIHLAQTSLLKIVPQKGTYVSAIDLSQVQESIFLRATMEHAVMKLACQKFSVEALRQLKANLAQEELCRKDEALLDFFQLDGEFHQTIFTACQKGRIWQMIVQMSQNYNRVRMLNLLDGRYEMERLFQQHQEIIDAIAAHDWQLGSVAMERHVHKVIPDLENLQARYPEYFSD